MKFLLKNLIIILMRIHCSIVTDSVFVKKFNKLTAYIVQNAREKRNYGIPLSCNNNWSINFNNYPVSSLSYLILIYLFFLLSFEKLPFDATLDDSRLPEIVFEIFNFSFIKNL